MYEKERKKENKRKSLEKGKGGWLSKRERTLIKEAERILWDYIYFLMIERVSEDALGMSEWRLV